MSRKKRSINKRKPKTGRGDGCITVETHRDGGQTQDRREETQGRREETQDRRETDQVSSRRDALSAGSPACGSPLKHKTSREVYFAILPDKYEPLIEELEEETEEERRRRKEEKQRKKREKCKKYRKNVGKALRFGWRCFVAGLQSFAAGYATPLSAAMLVTDAHRATSSKA